MFALKKTVLKAIPLAALAAATSGCSNQMIYELIQSNNRTECYKLPDGQMEECLDRSNLTYSEYLNARKTVDISALANSQ